MCSLAQLAKCNGSSEKIIGRSSRTLSRNAGLTQSYALPRPRVRWPRIEMDCESIPWRSRWTKATAAEKPSPIISKSLIVNFYTLSIESIQYRDYPLYETVTMHKRPVRQTGSESLRWSYRPRWLALRVVKPPIQSRAIRLRGVNLGQTTKPSWEPGAPVSLPLQPSHPSSAIRPLSLLY